MIAQETTTLQTHPCYIGIDVAKSNHVAAFISEPLLTRHKSFLACPTLPFENSRIGFERLIRAMESCAPLSQCTILMERTGHYHLALQQYLQERGIAVYEMHLQRRPSRNKSDKRDALGLANMLYSQIALGVQVDDPKQIAHETIIASPTATLLRGLVRHRIELSMEITRRKNKLIAICDQLLPEAAQVIVDLNCPAALRLWRRFPTATDIAAAELAELIATRTGKNPGNKVYKALQAVAATTIGITDPSRINVLAFERCQLIDELWVLERHTEELDARVEQIIAQSREGQILCSLPMISPTFAAAIIASIGTIANFERASKLRGYFGWSPNQRQTGISMDSMTLTRGGNRTMKRTMYLVGWQAVKLDTHWRSLYHRLIPVICRYDARTKKYKGKNKAMGRIIGQIIGLIYLLLRKDYELLISLDDGVAPPPPMLYNASVHDAHMRRC